VLSLYVRSAEGSLGCTDIAALESRSAPTSRERAPEGEDGERLRSPSSERERRPLPTTVPRTAPDDSGVTLWLPSTAIAGAAVSGGPDRKPLPTTPMYKYLGVVEGIAEDGHTCYAQHEEKVTAASKRHTRAVATSGICEVSIAATTAVHNGLGQPTVSYGAGAWAEGVVPTQLLKDQKAVMHMALHTSRLADVAAYAVSGIAPLQHGYDTLTLQRLVAACRAPRGSALRGAVTEQLLAWRGRGKGAMPAKQRKQLWIHSAMKLLGKLNDAIEWNTPVAGEVDWPHGSKPCKRPSSVKAYEYGPVNVAGDGDADGAGGGVAALPTPLPRPTRGTQGAPTTSVAPPGPPGPPTPPPPPTDWVDCVTRVLLYWEHALSADEETVLVGSMHQSRYAAMQVLRHKNRVCEVWTKASLVGVSPLLVVKPPPFTSQPWKDGTGGTRLRVMAHGGMWCLLDYRVYDVLRSTRYDGLSASGTSTATPACALGPPQASPSAPTTTSPATASTGNPPSPPTIASTPATPPSTTSPLAHPSPLPTTDPAGGGKSCTPPPKCPWCPGPLTVPHLVQDCERFNDIRAFYWGQAAQVLKVRGSNGRAVEDGAVTSRHPRDREQWYRLTMGREVDAKYFMGSAADPVPPSEALSMLAQAWVAEWLPAAPDQGTVADGGGAVTTATAAGGAGGTQTGTAGSGPGPGSPPQPRGVPDKSSDSPGSSRRFSTRAAWPELLRVTSGLLRAVVKAVSDHADPGSVLRKGKKWAGTSTRARATISPAPAHAPAHAPALTPATPAAGTAPASAAIADALPATNRPPAVTATPTTGAADPAPPLAASAPQPHVAPGPSPRRLRSRGRP
jgi:hypothetical protein